MRIIQEIGSNFELDPDSINSGKMLGSSLKSFCGNCSDSVFLSTGRGALNYVLDTIEERHPQFKKTALLPPYTCHTVIDPFLKREYELYAYNVDNELNSDLNKFRQSIISSGAQVVLVHRYFGFDTLPGFNQIIAEFAPKGVLFIEDRTHSLYGDFDSLTTDFTIASLRKWAALPDGGFATCKKGSFSGKPAKYDVELERLKIKASTNKFQYLHNGQGTKPNFLELFSKAEHKLSSQVGYYCISQSSAGIQKNLDLKELRDRRRRNYEYLYNGIKGIDGIRIVLPQLSNYDVPLYFVISNEDRDNLQHYLKVHDIYAPIVWPKPESSPPICVEAQHLYDTALCIPIDQRYSENDMRLVVDTIKGYGS